MRSRVHVALSTSLGLSTTLRMVSLIDRLVLVLTIPQRPQSRPQWRLARIRRIYAGADPCGRVNVCRASSSTASDLPFSSALRALPTCFQSRSSALALGIASEVRLRENASPSPCTDVQSSRTPIVCSKVSWMSPALYVSAAPLNTRRYQGPPRCGSRGSPDAQDPARVERTPRRRHRASPLRRRRAPPPRPPQAPHASSTPRVMLTSRPSHRWPY